MDLDLDEDQRAIVDAVRAVLSRVSRASGEMDHDGWNALRSQGFLDVAGDGGPRDHLAAVLVIEAAEGAALLAPVAASALVVPYVVGSTLPGPVALADGDGAIVRYGDEVQHVLMLEGEVVRLLDAGDVATENVLARTVYPLARVRRQGEGRVIPGAAARLRRAWRVALAAETAAAMTRAVDIARSHVQLRTQFGRPIGSFQAVAHRLADAHVASSAGTWLARRAAWHLDDDRSTAVAATYCTARITDVFDSVHQVVGAIGFTTEFDLHRSSLRLPVLATELGGAGAHARALSRLSWPAEPERMTS